MIAAKSLGKDAAAEARVGLAGPLAGPSPRSSPSPSGWSGAEFWRALAYLGFLLNLFNLSRSSPSTAAGRWRP